MADRMTASFASAADLSAKKGLVAQLDSNGKINVGTAATQALMGIIEDGGRASGDDCLVTMSGATYAKAGGTVTAGTHFWLTATTGGKLIATTTQGDMYIAIPLATAASDDEIPVWVCRGTYVGAAG